MELKDRKPRTGGAIVPMPLKNGGTAAAILGLVRRQVEDRTEYLMDGLKENVADALFEEMTGLGEEAALSHHFNIMRAIRVDEERYRARFEASLGQLWLSFFEEMDDGHICDPGGKTAETIKSMSDRVSNHYKVLIQETRFRFQTLLGREIEAHPLMPALYYRAFWDAIQELDLTHQEKGYLLPLFHRFVMDRYGQILAAANRTLIELKVDTTAELPAD